MKYKRIVVTKRGPPENLQIIECDLRDPLAKEARINGYSRLKSVGISSQAQGIPLELDSFVSPVTTSP